MMAAMKPMELWAGAECTLNRVGEAYFDQLERTGLGASLEDLDRLAQLGVRRIRFPILWERTAPERGREPDFRWSDERLERLRSLGIEPIVGLVHHGSGPPHTNLCDAEFARGLAEFAEQVARRYPWVSAYTPVNEPLTTARFSCLYGLWYPHERQLGAFVSALMNEVLAIRASMAAIRRINPSAELYQTEDLGQIFSTPDLEAQCRYERRRRWLSLDLLFGRVDEAHPLRRHLEEHGADPRLLEQWCREPCPPQIVGINYYVTSDRFLDSRLKAYPRHTWGGNDRQRYADLEAVRVRPEGILGHAALLQEAFARYGAPCALTEVHLGCQREEQLRWLYEAWQGAQAARAKGADVRALTLWSAFGAVGWNNLVTSPTGEYEPGAYDIRAPEPRPTALARLARSLARGDRVEPIAGTVGWWRRSTRLIYSQPKADQREPARSRLLVLGAGHFARRVADLCGRRFECVTAPTRGLAEALLAGGGTETGSQRPIWALVVAQEPAREAPLIERDVGRSWRLPGGTGAPLPVMALSSDCVFDGWLGRPYVESDETRCADAQAESWGRLELDLMHHSPATLIVRSGLAIDPELPGDLLATVMDALRVGRRPRLPAWQLVSPTYLPQLVDTALDLLVDGERGIWHLAPRSPCSVLELARRIAKRLGLTFHTQVDPSSQRGVRGPMRALASERGWPLPELPDALEAYVRDLESHRRSVTEREERSSRRA